MNLKIQKAKIIQLDWILKGSVLKQYKQCGKINCLCMKNRKYWHGPYYIWTRKEKGKTVTKTLTHKQAKYVQNAFLNIKKINQYLEKWKTASLKNLENIL